MTRKTAIVAAVAALLATSCGSDEISVEEAQAQFCSDVEEYVAALDTYGGLFEDVDLTVGDVRSAADDLDPAREAVGESAAAFREAVEADPDSTPHERAAAIDDFREIQLWYEQDFFDDLGPGRALPHLPDPVLAAADLTGRAGAWKYSSAWREFIRQQGAARDEGEPRPPG